MKKALVLLFVFGMSVFWQTPVTSVLVTSVSVRTDFATQSQPNSATFMVADWKKGEIYVSNNSSVNVISTKNWTVVREIPLPLPPRAMCFSSVAGLIAMLPAGSSAVSILNVETGSFQAWGTGLNFAAAGCSFSADGGKLYASIDLRESPELPKVSEIEVTTGKVVRTWTTDKNTTPYIQALPNGKVYVLSRYLLSSTGNLKVIGTDGEVKSVDLGGMMPWVIAITPDGLAAYIGGSILIDGKYASRSVIVNTETDEVVWEGNIFKTTESGIPIFPHKDDSCFMLVGNAIGVEAINLGRGTSSWVISDGQTTHGLTAREEIDGSSSTIAVLRDGRVDVYRVERSPTIYSVVNSASFARETPPKLSPGGLGTIFAWTKSMEPVGTDWGQPLPTTLEDIRVIVRVNGVEFDCSLLYVSRGQINFWIPFHIPLGTAELELRVGSKLDSIGVEILEADPGIFINYGTNEGAIVDENFRLVSASNPAKSGHYVHVYTTGLGSPRMIPTPLPGMMPCALPIKVTVGGVDAEVNYAGTTSIAPGLYWVTIKVPAGLHGYQEVIIDVNGRKSNTAIIAVQ